MQKEIEQIKSKQAINTKKEPSLFGWGT